MREIRNLPGWPAWPEIGRGDHLNVTDLDGERHRYKVISIQPDADGGMTYRMELDELITS